MKREYENLCAIVCLPLGTTIGSACIYMALCDIGYPFTAALIPTLFLAILVVVTLKDLYRMEYASMRQYEEFSLTWIFLVLVAWSVGVIASGLITSELEPRVLIGTWLAHIFMYAVVIFIGRK